MNSQESDMAWRNKIISKNVIDGTIDLLNIEKYRKIENTREYFIFIKWIMLPLNRRSMHFCGFL